MQDDERCCGTGTCIVDGQGLCWCGQQWDGKKMCRPKVSRLDTFTAEAARAITEESPIPVK